MKSALVIGGTGMLGAATRGLADRGYLVALFARGATAFAGADPRLRPFTADWSDRAAFLEAVEAAAAAHGPFDKVLLWRHDRPRGLALDVAGVLARHGRTRRFFHVVGSAVSDPSNEGALERAREAFAAVLPGAWRPICLGFRIEGASSRWLTNEEISEGALAAIDADAPSATIGVTRPWNRRPPSI